MSDIVFKPLSSVQTFSVFKGEAVVAIAQVINGELTGVFSDRELTVSEKVLLATWAHEAEGFRLSETFCRLGSLTNKKRAIEAYA